MPNKLQPGYLSEVEASHLLTQAIPGAIIVHLKRDIEAEVGRPARRMFIELSLGEAVQHWQHMGEPLMQDCPPSVTTTEFGILARRAGLTLDETQHDHLYSVYGHLEAMLARLRGASDRARGAEPAHVFVPGQGWPGHGG